MTTQDRVPRIGIVGTFDVANYGDLLFPMIAERELAQRLGDIELIRFSYTERRAGEWPFATVSLAELPRLIDTLDLLVIGGGHVIRFDKAVAPGYEPPAGIHHPTGYWLTPALLAQRHGVPVAWNAPGMHAEDVPRWAEPMLRLALDESSYVAVRDARSRDALLQHTDREISVVADTAFGLAHVPQVPSEELCRLCERRGLEAPYVIVQAARTTQHIADLIGRSAAAFEGLRFVSLPIGPVLGDDDTWVAGLPDALRLPTWPSPLLIAELIAGSQGVIGNSFHLAVTALANGIPVIRTEDFGVGKFSALEGFEEIVVATLDEPGDAERVAATLVRGQTTAALPGILDELATHWDRIAELATSGRTGSSTAADRYLQQLPTALESAAVTLAAERTAAEARADELERAFETELAARSGELHTRTVELEATRAALQQHVEALAEARARIELLVGDAQQLTDAARTAELEHGQALSAAEAEWHRLRGEVALGGSLVANARGAWAATAEQTETLHGSTSWRATAPLRWLSGRLGRPAAPRPILRTAPILRSTMNTAPFEWGLVEGVFAPDDAAALAADYPLDHFATFDSSDGEKAYRYDARALLPMGVAEVAHRSGLSDAWQQLAADLSSPAYRIAMSLLTGRDLSACPIEANVFHYGPGTALGPHLDLADKVVTHVLYFNTAWDPALGGCLTILPAKDAPEASAIVLPIVGTSAVLVRSDRSWHSVPELRGSNPISRRSVTVTFYRPGSISSMWTPATSADLHDYSPTT